MTPLKIRGTGIYQPNQSLLSSTLDKNLGKEEGWVENKFGIKSRGVANDSETTSFMGAQAAQKALAKAKWNKNELDIIIGACGVMEQPIPSTSVLIQNKLGLGSSGIPTFDVNLTCLSFLTAFNIASMGIASNNWKKILIVSSDIASAGLDYSIPETACIFGDGAAAICLEASENHEDSGIISKGFETYGDAHHVATLRSGGTKLRMDDNYDEFIKGTKFEMDSFGVFKSAGKCLPKLIDKVLQEGGHNRESIDLIICHQASAPGIEHIRRLFKSNPQRVVNIFPTFGNQIATSLPTTLSYAIEHGLAKPKNTILLLGTAAGVSAGAILLRL